MEKTSFSHTSYPPTNAFVPRSATAAHIKRAELMRGQMKKWRCVVSEPAECAVNRENAIRQLTIVLLERMR